MSRKHMPPERANITRRVTISGLKFYVTVGLYPDGSPGEVFITLQKQGSLEHGMCHCVALLISMLLQRGVPLAEVVGKLKDIRFDPSGMTNDPEIPMASSVVDYVARWLDKKFLKGDPNAKG